MKIYCVELINYDGDNFICGYATSVDKAEKMIDFMKTVDGFDDCDYDYHWVYVDTLIINNEKITI